MTLIKTSILTGASTIIKALSLFFINKIVALYIGPSGLAIIGQLHNFVSMITIFSNGGVTNGIVKYTAEYQTIDEKTRIFSAGIKISLICSFILSAILFIFADSISNLILKTTDYEDVFRLFGLTIFLFSLNTVFLSILNGQKEIKKYVLANIASSIAFLVLTVILVYLLNLRGALYALVLSQSLVFFVTLAFVVKSQWFKFEYFNRPVDLSTFKKLSKYSLMTVISASVAPISLLLIRNYLGEYLDWNQAGYWQGMWYISSLYLMVVTTTLSVYYLPRLSEIQDKKELILEILHGYKIIIPVVISLASVIFMLKDYIIWLAFSGDFMSMRELFAWQMVGDCVKMASWLLGYVLWAKAMAGLFIVTEIVFSLSFVLLSVFFVNLYGLIGVTYGYSLNCLLYFATLFLILRRKAVI